MITPHDLEVKVFERSMRGYKCEEVDEFLELLQQDYERMYKENGVLKNKIGVLVEKIEEYKKNDESLREAIISAQKMGDNIIGDANKKAELIVREAEQKASAALQNATQQVYREQEKLQDAQREYKLFQSKLVSMYQAQITLMQSLDGATREDAQKVRRAIEETLDSPKAAPEKQTLSEEFVKVPPMQETSDTRSFSEMDLTAFSNHD